MRPPYLPRLALRLLLPAEPREVILGDLDEEFEGRLASPAARDGRRSLRFWYWRMAGASLAAFWNPLRWVRLARGVVGRGGGSGIPRNGGPERPPAGRGSGVPGWVGDRMRDARFAVRSWARSPGLSVTIAVTLALGIGVNTAVFSMADAVLLRPVAGVRDADDLVIVKFEQPDGNGTGVSWPNAADLRASAPGLAGLTGYQNVSANLRPEGGAPRTGRGEVVVGDYFDVLGVRPLLGRLPSSAELEDPDPPAVVVLSERFWRVELGADPSVTGSTLEINGTPFTVVGVTDGYEGTLRTSRSEFFLPGGRYATVQHFPPDYGMTDRSFRFLFQLVGRPGRDVTPATVQAQLRAGMERLTSAYPDANGIHQEYRPTVYPGIGLTTGDQGRTARAMTILGLVVGLVLLIACANVANVLVARGIGRLGESAVRRALGASRRRLAAQHLTESVVLALPGGLLGLAVAAGVLDLLGRLPSTPFLLETGVTPLDARVLAFTLAATLATGLAFGLIPALLAGRRDVAPGLTEAARRDTPRLGAVRSGLTVLQIALSLTLLVGATLLVRTLGSLGAVDLGFDPAGLSVHALDPERQGYAATEVDAFADALLSGVRQIPGVRSAALTGFPPFGGSSYRTRLRPADEPDREPLQPMVMWVSDGFFETLGQPVVRGRDFTTDEQALAPEQEPPSMLVNETLARALFGDAPAVGRRVVQPLYGGPVESVVVGVVADTRVRSFEESDAVLYRPHRDRRSGVMALIRSQRPTDEVREAVQAVARDLDPSLPLTLSEPVEAAVERATAEQRLFATLLGLTAVLAATLAAVGLYGVVAHGVARRRREFGIRIAVGAGHGRIVRGVLLRSATLGATGIVLGWGGAALLSRLLESRLFGVEPLDPATFAGAGGAFLALTVLAALAPALSATRVDPSRALRAE